MVLFVILRAPHDAAYCMWLFMSLANIRYSNNFSLPPDDGINIIMYNKLIVYQCDGFQSHIYL